MSRTTGQKTFCVETYIKTVQAKFRRRFDSNHFPNKSMIYRWVKFKSKGTVLKLSTRNEKVTTGRHLSVSVPGNADAVHTSVGRNPRKSIQRRSQEYVVAILNTQGVHKVRVHFKRCITLFVFAIEIICKKCYKVSST